MNNLVRFFTDEKEMVLKQFNNIPIPDLGSTVFIYDEPYFVYDITYDFDDCGDGFNLIDVFIEKHLKG